LYKEKISISNIVFIINSNGYIGDDTLREIEYAKSLNKKIAYYTHYKTIFEEGRLYDFR